MPCITLEQIHRPSVEDFLELDVLNCVGSSSYAQLERDVIVVGFVAHQHTFLRTGNTEIFY